MNEKVDSKQGFLENFKEYHKRDFIILPQPNDEKVRKFLTSHDVVFVKVNFSNKGEGVKRYKSNELLSNPEMLDNILKMEGAMEEAVVQCKEMAALNPDTVNTLRVCTMVEKDGTIRLFSAALRIGAKGEAVDNAHHGGICAPIDLNSGIVTSVANNSNLEKFIFSPGGAVIPGFQIPYWEKVVDAVLSAATKFPKARFIGWDVAIREDGPVFIEANNASWGGLFQFDGGKWDYFLRQR